MRCNAVLGTAFAALMSVLAAPPLDGLTAATIALLVALITFGTIAGVWQLMRED